MASTTTTATAAKAATDIDDLLTTYLELLDTYTTLRSKLTSLQSSTSLSLARATFSTPNRLGYIPQSTTTLRASARLRVSPPDVSAPFGGEDAEGEVFTLLPLPSPVPASAPSKDDAAAEEGDAEVDTESDADSTEDADSEPTKSKSAPAPPLPPGFGALPPPSLREAQASAIEAIHIITQLAGVDVKMRAVEVEVRRGRKRAAKVKAAEEKEGR
ncbi:hypothetical protein O988_06952 [Pseudogymnoascus sp. VKM F-3808]|nr:hypothetical protein O988_06952 [Pseudogymnoascus sp. VKM F-3808]